MHCFTGSKEFAHRLIDIDCYFSASGVITFKKSKELAQTFKSIPNDKILVETDSPYLSPEPLRGKINVPSNIVHTVKFISILKETTEKDVEKFTTNNFQQLFKINIRMTKITILGCGSSLGSPWITNYWGKLNKKNKFNIRTRCSAHIKKGNLSILIDTSPDIKKQVLDNKIKNIDYVLYTHEHADQTSGIFELRPFFWKNKKPINIYANKKCLKLLKINMITVFMVVVVIFL